MFPIVAVHDVALADANRLLEQWAHPLGACRRPFRSECHVMTVEGEPVAVTVSASIVSATVAGRARGTVVELARIARAPGAPWVLRPMLRIWRATLAPRWACWPVAAAVAYALPGTPGDIYRFDGWHRAGSVAPSGGGGTWSRRPVVNDVGDGRKSLWLFEYGIACAP